MLDFPGITKQARGIARLYKWFGLYSIPLLTIVTVISISNVFTRGQLAQASWLQFLWAIIFAAAIEVNIVRLFFEAKFDHDRTAKVLGIGLAIVAGAALLIEGLQQSIGFAWDNPYIQWIVGSVIFLRVLVVVVLMAREGSKLAFTLTLLKQEELVNSVQPMYACPVYFPEPKTIQQVFSPIKQPIEQEAFTETEQQENTSVNTSSNVVPFSSKPTGDKAKRVQRALKLNPDASLSEIARKTGASRGYVSQIRKDTSHMPAITVDTVPATNGHH